MLVRPIVLDFCVTATIIEIPENCQFYMACVDDIAILRTILPDILDN